MYELCMKNQTCFLQKGLETGPVAAFTVHVLVSYYFIRVSLCLNLLQLEVILLTADCI